MQSVYDFLSKAHTKGTTEASYARLVYFRLAVTLLDQKIISEKIKIKNRHHRKIRFSVAFKL